MLSRYILGGLLGTGASASVFLATDSLTGEEVAVKVLHPQLAARPELVKRFLSEAQRLEGVVHPNITQVIEWGTQSDDENNDAWIVYELAPGISLSEYVERHGPLPPSDAINVMSGVLGGLGVLHQHGLVHRDISPSNVIINAGIPTQVKSADVRLIDYGLVGKIGTSTRNGSGVVGNAHYISPEQSRGDGVYPSGDIYQAGGVLYFCLTGTPPFEAESVEELLSAHATTVPPVPSALISGIPRELDRAVVKALLKSPTMRYRNVGEFNRTLSGIFGRDVSSTEALSPYSPSLEQTKVLPMSPTSFVDSERTMLLSVAYQESEDALRIRTHAQSARNGRPKIRPWVWPAVFATVLGIAVVTGIATAQGDNEPLLLEASPSQESSPSVTASEAQTTAQNVVPDLALLSLEEARNAVSSAGLVVSSEKYTDSFLPEDTVVSSEPEAGIFLPKGSKVTLRIASGLNKVPIFESGLPSDALSQLKLAGFTVSVLDQAGFPVANEAIISASKVIELKPKAGSLLRVGSTVIVIVSMPMPTVLPTLTPSPASTVAPSTTPTP